MWLRKRSRNPVQLLGLEIPCWKCQALTVCVVGFLDTIGGSSEYDLVRADDDDCLSLAADLLGEGREHYRVGSIRRRFSRTLGDHQVANGCFECDALQGNFFLFNEELPEALFEGGLEGLIDLGTYELPG